MLKIEKLKTDEKFERLTPVTKEELKALESLIVADGEMHTPIIVWQGQNIVVDGHSRREILKNHPELKYSIKEIEFGDWQDVIVWIVEHHIARKSFSLWQKLEMAMACVEYWEAKEKASNNQGSRTDLLSPSDKKLEAIDMDKIIAQKVGCSKTYVTMFKIIFKSPKENIKQRCREGSMSIKMAYESLKPKKPSKKKPETTVENEKVDILADCEKNQNVTNSGNISIPDPTPIVKEMTQPKVPDEVMWFAINPIDQTIQIFKKTHDADKGINQIHVNTFSFISIPQEGKTSILQVEHIGGSTEDIKQKDDKCFDSKEKKAS